MDDAGKTFVIDVHRDQRIFLDNPRRAKKRRATPETSPGIEDLRVDEWVGRQPAAAWQEVWVRRGSQGELRVQALRRRVWVREAKETQARCWQLIVTREIEAPDTTKYSFRNAVEKTSLQRLAYMQRQRYWVERAFQEAKNEAGMDEYQARSWQAWYHHMALVMMALLFILKEKQLQSEALPLLSATDVKHLLVRLLPRRDLDIEESIRQVQSRHRQRQAAIDSASRRQQESRDSTSSTNLTK